MSRGTTEVITFKADMDDLRDQLSKLPGVTDKEAKAMVRSLERQMKRTERAAKKAATKSASSFEKMAKKADETKESFGRLGAAAGKISPSIGGLVTGLGDMLGVAGALTNPIGAVAAGATAVGIAATGGAVAVAGLVAGLTAATLAADELIDELDQFGDFAGVLPEISAAEIEAIERANAAVESLGLAAKSAVVQLGADFAPTLEAVATRALAAGLAVFDLTEEVIKIVEVAGDGARSLLSFVASLDHLGGMLSIVPGMGSLGDALQLSAIGAQSLTVAIDGLTNSTDPYISEAERMISAVQDLGNAEATTATQIASADDALKANQGLWAIYVATLDGLPGKLAAIDLAYSQQVAKIGELVEAGASQADAQRALAAVELQRIQDVAAAEQAAATARAEQNLAEYQQKLELQESAQKAEAAALKELGALRQKEHDEAIAETRQLEQIRMQSTDDILSASVTALGLMSDRMAEEGNEAAIGMFRLEKSAALAQIAMHTAAGVMRSFDDLPLPAALVASAGIVALGAAQAAVVASQPPPEIAHTGAIVGMGSIAGGGGLGPDERMVRARVGEGVLTSQAVRAVGGADGVAALNSGRAVGGGAPIVVAQVYRGRVLDVAIQDQLGRQSALRRATAPSRPRGRKNVYNGAL